MGQDVVRKSLCGHTHGVLVHPVGSHAHNAAETARSEFEILVECVLKSCRIGVAQLQYFHFGFLVEITIQPTLGFQFKFFHW